MSSAVARKAPTVAGIALIAADTGRMLMLQRGLDDTDDPAAGTWEWPGGHLEASDDSSLHGGMREWAEEVGRRFPRGGTVEHTWTSANGVYQGHVVVIDSEDQVNLAGRRTVDNADDDYSEQAAWWRPEDAQRNPALRRECRAAPWDDIIRIARRAHREATRKSVPGWEGTVGPFPDDYGRPHTYARDVQSGAGNCVCGRDPGHRLHVSGKDVYAAMAPATRTRTLGNARPGRSPSGLHGRPHPPTLRDAARTVRRKRRDGRTALADARKALAAGPDLEVLELYRAATAEVETGLEDKGVRRVRTAAGARRYGAPIGTPIVRDARTGKLRAKKPGERGADETRKPPGGGRGLPIPGGGSDNDRGGSGRGGGGNGGGGGGGGGGGVDALGGALGGLAGLLGGLLGAGGKGKKPKKPKKGRKPRKPPKPKKGRAGTGGSGNNTGADDATLDAVIDGLAGLPPDKQQEAVDALPQPILDDVSDRLLRRTGAAPPGQKALLAARLEVKGAPSRMPGQLLDYWSGEGAASWAGNPHPYTALVRELREHGVPGRMVHGAAANVFRRVFGIFPGQRPRSGSKALTEAKARLTA